LLLACGLLFSFSSDLRAADSSHPCASVARDVDRLACYDRHFGRPKEHSNGASSHHSGGDQPASAKNSSIKAGVTAVARRQDGLFVVTLDNGQVWSQSELDSRAEVRVGDTVSVRRGAFGSHLLITTAGIGTRVKRVR
jgi:hypothetical protein